MKNWRPHIDLDWLSVALGAEILSASDQEVHAAAGWPGQSVGDAAEEVRLLLAAATGDPAEDDPHVLVAPGVLLRAPLGRQH